MHYKTIKFNIKIPLNIHNFHFCGAEIFWHFSNSPPPSPNPQNGSTPLTVMIIHEDMN